MRNKKRVGPLLKTLNIKTGAFTEEDDFPQLALDGAWIPRKKPEEQDRESLVAVSAQPEATVEPAFSLRAILMMESQSEMSRSRYQLEIDFQVGVKTEPLEDLVERPNPLSMPLTPTGAGYEMKTTEHETSHKKSASQSLVKPTPRE